MLPKWYWLQVATDDSNVWDIISADDSHDTLGIGSRGNQIAHIDIRFYNKQEMLLLINKIQHYSVDITVSKFRDVKVNGKNKRIEFIKKVYLINDNIENENLKVQLK